MTLIEQRTWSLECHAQTTITAQSYPREGDLPEGWRQLPKDPPRREKHLCEQCKETTESCVVCGAEATTTTPDRWHDGYHEQNYGAVPVCAQHGKETTA